MVQKTVPDVTDHSAGNQINFMIMQYLKVVETTPGTNPPLVARWWFLFGCLVWNSYAVMDPKFPFVDGFEATRCALVPNATETQKWDIMLQLLQACYAGLKSTELPNLPLIVLPPNTLPLNYVSNTFVPAVNAYLATRAQDGYNTTKPYTYPNQSSYIQVGTNTIQNLNIDLPSPSTWAPLDTHYPDGSETKQKPVAPYYSEITNWLSPDELTHMYEIAERYYPTNTIFQQQETAMVNLVATLTEAEKLKAEIWAGTTRGLASPPSKWMVFIALLIASNSMELKETAAIVGGVTFSLFHAGICAWGVKYKYMQPRPIQVLRRDYLGQQIVYPITGQLGNGGAWIPYQQSNIYTPGFPDYVSGHSTFSMAVATFLQMLLGSDTIPIYSMIDISYFQAIATMFNTTTEPSMLSNLTLPPKCSIVDPNLPTVPIDLNWTTWTGLAREVGISRVYGNIHWDNSNLGGLCIGQWVGTTMLKKINWDSLGLNIVILGK